MTYLKPSLFSNCFASNLNMRLLIILCDWRGEVEVEVGEKIETYDVILSLCISNNIMYPFLMIVSAFSHMVILLGAFKEPACIVMPTEHSYMHSKKECLDGKYEGELTCPAHGYPILNQQLIQHTHVKISFYTIMCESTKICCARGFSGRATHMLSYIYAPIRDRLQGFHQFCGSYLQSFATSRGTAQNPTKQTI